MIQIISTSLGKITALNFDLKNYNFDNSTLNPSFLDELQHVFESFLSKKTKFQKK